MASTKTDANTPKTGAVKKWDGIAERDLCLAIILGGGGEGEKFRLDWNTTHSAMTYLGYDFSKDAISQRWSKTLLKEFRSRHAGADLASPASPLKPPPANKRKQTASAAAAAATTSDEAASDNGGVEETAAAAATPPATPKGRKRAPAKPKAAVGPPKPRGRRPKSAATVKAEDGEDNDEPTTTPAKAAVEKPAATAKKGPTVKNEDTEQTPEDQPSPSKKAKVEAQEDTELTDDV